MHKPKELVDTMGRWVTFSLSHYTRKTLQRPLGRIGWLARRGLSADCFLACAHTWLRLGPLLARSVPFAVCRPKGQRSASTLMVLRARLCEGVSLLGCGARRALPSTGARRGSGVSSRLSCLGLCALDVARSSSCRHADLVIPPTASRQRPWTPPSLRRWWSEAPRAPLAGALLQGGGGGA